MNIVQISSSVVRNMMRSSFDAKDCIRFVGKTDYSLRHFSVLPKEDGVVMWFEYEIIEYCDISPEMVPGYSGTGPIIKYTNHYDKANPNDVWAGRTFENINEARVTSRSVFIHPQIITKDGKAMFDLYVEAVGKDEGFHDLSDEQQIIRTIRALQLLDYVESRLKKETHRIKKIMPAPEAVADADKSKKPYVSKPIVVKDLIVQYIYEPHKTRQFNRHCEAWSVRGHYRHYKSGKVIYIAPHTKGKGRLKETLYRI